jgi:hypothetical protein
MHHIIKSILIVILNSIKIIGGSNREKNKEEREKYLASIKRTFA